MAMETAEVQAPLPSPSAAARPRAVTHAASAAVAGVLLCLGIPVIGLLAFAGLAALLLGVAVLILGSGAVFGLTGSGFLGRRGWWLAFTALPWTAAVVAFWLLGLSTGGLWTFVLTAGTAGAAVGAGCALLAWRGTPQIVGGVMLLVVTGVAVAWMSMLALAAVQQQATKGFRTEIPVFTTEVPGYTAGESTTSPGGTAVTYSSGDQAFLLSSEPLDTDPCGAALTAFDGVAEAELSCTASAERWYRTSASLHEVAVVRDGWIVRASADRTVPLGVLENAAALAIPEGEPWTTDAP